MSTPAVEADVVAVEVDTGQWWCDDQLWNMICNQISRVSTQPRQQPNGKHLCLG